VNDCDIPAAHLLDRPDILPERKTRKKVTTNNFNLISAQMKRTCIYFLQFKQEKVEGAG
jgi:hypothetical protein